MHYNKTREQKFRSLIDTGAEVSLVSEKVIEKINPKPKLSRRKVALQSVSGEALFVKGITDLEFKVGNQKFVHTCQVVRGLNRNFILRTDWRATFRLESFDFGFIFSITFSLTSGTSAPVSIKLLNFCSLVLL